MIPSTQKSSGLEKFSSFYIKIRTNKIIQMYFAITLFESKVWGVGGSRIL